MNYYNENDTFAAAWLRELIKAGHIPAGDVDTRSIEDVRPNDLDGYTQCHFFAGIGGWSYALKLAGWPEDKPVWTGSCPCQPFSPAGKRKGATDERHLWPAWFHLIEQCLPATIFGEQVASKDGLQWFDTVSADLEGAGYASGVADLCAAGVDAPHIRQRLYFGAQRIGQPDSARLEGCLESGKIEVQEGRKGAKRYSSETGLALWVANVDSNGRTARNTLRSDEAEQNAEHGSGPVHAAQTGSAWEPCEWLLGRDQKWRPVKPCTFPLVNGVSAGVGRLRGYGNAIVPQVAAEFIKAWKEIEK